MDNFFQTLRDIQKKERTSGTLSEIDDTFYDDASKYLNELLEIVNQNPLSLESYQLREAQRITIEISERREFKIITSAITNVQKSHNLLEGMEKNSQLYDEVPYNTTPEEEKLYKDVVNDMIKHRGDLINQMTPQPTKNETKIGFKPQSNESSTQEVIDETTGETTGDNLLDIVDVPVRNDSQTVSVKNQTSSNKAKLDASQVAQMFGQAPDDILLDENNNPVEPKSVKRKDIMAPFEPPKVPDNDTVTLQNQNKNMTDDKKSEPEISSENTDTRSVKTDISKESPTISEDSQAVSEENNNISSEDISQLDDDLPEEIFVEFIENINTDILDENERTYGPFNIGDMALLPKSIVKILKIHNVINIL